VPGEWGHGVNDLYPSNRVPTFRLISDATRAVPAYNRSVPAKLTDGHGTALYGRLTRKGLKTDNEMGVGGSGLWTKK